MLPRTPASPGLSPPLGPDDRLWEATAVGVTICLLSAAAAYRLWPQRDLLKSIVRELLTLVHSGAAKAGDASPDVERRIREECQRRHLQRAELLLILGNVCYVVQLLIHLVNILTGEPFINLVQACMLYPLFLVNALFSLSRRAITPRTVDGLYCFNMLWTVTYILMHDLSHCRIHLSRVYCLILVLYMGLFNLKPWLNTLGVLAVATAESTMLFLTSRGCLCTWSAYAFVIFVLFGVHYILTDGVRLEIVGTDCDNELAAVKTLLDSICDVIVQLDAGLRMKGHSPKLADILFHGGGRDYEGADIRDLLATDEDRLLFDRRIGAPSEKAPAHADVFHARMRDGSGAALAMEFFSVAFRGPDSTMHRYLGLREYTDIAPVVRGPPPPPVPVVMPKQRAPMNRLGTPAGRQQADIRSHSTGSRSNSPRSTASSSSSNCARGSAGDGGGGRGDTCEDVRGDPGACAAEKAVQQTNAEKATSGRRQHSNGEGQEVVRGGGAGAAIETKYPAKRGSLEWTLTSWSLEPLAAGGHCCPLHAALADLRGLLPTLATARCKPRFGPTSKWQCPTCGIRSEEWRNPKRRSRCLLCKNWSLEELVPGAGAAEVEEGAASKQSL